MKRTIGPKNLSESESDRIRALSIFQGIDEAGMERLLADSHVADFLAGAGLFVQADPADRFFVVLEGWIKLYRSTVGGHESVVSVVAPGESFAEAAIFDSQVYPVSATVVSDARLLIIPALRFLRVLKESPELALSILASMSRRLRYLVHQIEQISANSASERLAFFLLKLCPNEDGAITLHLPIDKTLIAGRLAMQPETLSRALSKLRTIGVDSQGHQVRIADTRALREWTAARAQ